jgi:hypothetical protein
LGQRGIFALPYVVALQKRDEGGSLFFIEYRLTSSATKVGDEGDDKGKL